MSSAQDDEAISPIAKEKVKQDEIDEHEPHHHSSITINNNDSTTNSKKQDPVVEKPPRSGGAAANNSNNNMTQDPSMNLEDPQHSFAPFLEEKAQKALREERWREALNSREHVLRCYLRAFGEQSNEANLQKQLLAALILKAGDFETREKEDQQQANSSASSRSGVNNTSTLSNSSAAGSRSQPMSDGAHRPKNLLSSMFGSYPVGDLTMSSRLEYAQMLLSPQSIGPLLSEDPNLRHLRSRLMIAHSTITSRLHRPRSAIPMLTEAMRLLQGLIQDVQERDNDEYGGYGGDDSETQKQVLSPSSQEAARLELCECYLTKSVLLSNCSKHEEALATSMWGLAAILQLEEESWRNFQDLHGRDPHAPRARIFHASLQAACHHNIGAEQEHLGLTELALDSYETGFELAVSCFGIQHPMSERLKMCYSELFSSLHYKHFVKNGEQRDVARQALRDPEIAITHLRASYYASERHRAALGEQTKKQTKMLAKAGTDASLSKAGGDPMRPPPRATSANSANSKGRRRKASASSGHRSASSMGTVSASAQRPMTATPKPL